MSQIPDKNQNSSINNSGIRILGYTIFLIMGLLSSLKMVQENFHPDPDTAHSIMLWEGITTHGIEWVKDWIFTQDNWLLSLIPFHFLGFLIFGSNIYIAIIFGWIIFVSSAAIAGIIAWNLGAKKTSVPIFLILLNLGYYAHTHGFVSYSTSHNITNFFGLLSILMVISWPIRKKGIYLGALFLVLVFASVSDPWMIPAYTLPILLVAMLAIFVKSHLLWSRGDSLKILTVAILSIIATRTKLFGSLDFLPSIYFQIGDLNSFYNNVNFLIIDLAAFLNLSIFFGFTDKFLPSLVLVASMGAILLYLGYFSLVKKNILDAQAKTFISISILSIGGISMAFVVSSSLAALYSGRFLINVVYLYSILTFVISEKAWNYFGKNTRGFLIFLIVVFFSTGLLSNLSQIKSNGYIFNDRNLEGTLDFYKNEGLSYGYGPYWSSNANAVTAFSNGEVTIRPIIIDQKNGVAQFGGRAESSNRWYELVDIPSNVKEIFIFLNAEAESCPDLTLCLRGLSKQFGSPNRVLSFPDKKIVIWDAEQFKLRTAIRISKNNRYFFGSSGQHLSTPGWSVPEDWGVWSSGSNSMIRLDMTNIQPNKLVIEGIPLLSASHRAQRINITLNSMPVGTVLLASKVNDKFSLSIPDEIKETLKMNPILSLKLSFPDAVAPMDIGLGGDNRKLAFGLISLTVE